MAGTSRPTVKPDGPFAYTNIHDVIGVPKTGDATLPAGAAGVMVLGGVAALMTYSFFRTFENRIAA